MGKAKWYGAKRRIYICGEAATTTLNPKPLLLFRHDPVGELFCRDFHEFSAANFFHDD